jgi:cytochrome c-type biogenesis protein CcmH
MRRPNPFPTLWTLAALVFAAAASPGPEDGEIAAKAREIEDQLIAPCCWTQTVSQHYSEVSEQIRKEVRAMVEAGKSRDEILDHYVAKYGERILAAPRARGFNILAYVLPWTVLIAGVWLLFVLLRKLLAPAPADGPPPQADPQYISRVEQEIQELDE